MKAAIKKLVILVLPLFFRKRLAVWLNRQAWLSPAHRSYWCTQLLTDFEAADVNAYHKFLWEHHLAYAESYEVQLRFGYERFNETRKLLFAELPQRVRDAGLGSATEIRSVLEIGCSLGYLLRYMETDLFPEATRLEGIDIDMQAIEQGKQHLASLGSRVSLHHGDMESLDIMFADVRFDLVLASGVLLYLDQESATRLVGTMLRHTGKLLTITALAHLDVDNSCLTSSVRRESDGTWIHNVDRMVEQNGGRLVARRWQGGELIDGNTIYFLYAVPGEGGDGA